VKKQGIVVEICPISNHILCYVKDIRHHPGKFYLNNNIKVSISSDDPGFFGYDGVSPDFFWITLMWDLNLQQLKKLVINSIDSD
jgi:adenosine deaminase CECR1